jgi:hypothetical protein
MAVDLATVCDAIGGILFSSTPCKITDVAIELVSIKVADFVVSCWLGAKKGRGN